MSILNLLIQQKKEELSYTYTNYIGLLSEIS